MMNNKYFEVERITNGASGEKRTTKTFKDEEKAIAYAKRYHRTTKTIKSVKTTVYYFNGTDTGITYRANTKDGTEKDYREQTTEEEAITLAKTIANDKNRTVQINRNGVTITKVIPERKYRFVPTESANVTAVTFGNTEEITVTFEGTDTEKQAIKFAEEMSAKNNRFYEIYEIVLGDKNKYIKTVKPKEQEQEKKIIGYRVGLGGTIYNTAEEAFRNNPKDEKQVFRIVEKDELTWSYEPIDKPIEKEVKTLQDWEKKGGNFTDFCKVGDKVDKGIVDYFVDVLPPITWRTDLVQCGEPYGHRDNPKTGRWEAMYITFAKNDNGQWYYAGICFLNQREAIA